MKRMFVLLAILGFAGLTQIAQGQWFVPSAPSSVTSVAPGRPFLPPPSVIATGPQGWRPQHFNPGNRFVLGRGGVSHGGFNHHRARGGNGIVGAYSPYVMPYPVYVEPDYGYDPNADAAAPSMYEPDPNYAGQYGLIDPRKRPNPNSATTTAEPRDNSYNSESSRSPVASTTVNASTSPRPEPKAQPATILVFKDGHRLEVTNYVIQGATLFNLGDNGPRKIAVADLDVDKTMNINDERGVEFSLP